ncbi:serine hydrolase domain-containing protein [Nonomuraea diastatica]|uniref:Class A beta-lactamase-related serine hydrolase n=1 Tax=Nonomuraea diastatica TaxID=1848329 RepID=A0A4R4WMM6_9ACTN|nr:serine hydrolase domain-containing protein [Nonomuraea diastatica]TDD18877.1 class A beta-lactamase-related serine hydrolase [Nonomuraea diastatica]
MSDLQKQVQQAADRLVESGEERGLQVAVYRDGVQIVDVVAGVADPETGRPVTPDTPFYNYSIGKGATATIAHLLVERGLFGYDTPVAELWPEFARHGKQGVTVRHVLSHTAGVPGVPLDTTPEDACDWGKMVAALEDAKLWWEPGTKVGYHAYTFGYLVGEIVRRATGKPISQVLLEDVAGPLGVAGELYFGMPEKEHARLARLEDAPMDMSAFGEMPADLPMFKAGPMELMPGAELGNRPDYLSVDIPAGGKTSARAIARMYAALLGEVDGVRLITEERLREATAVVSSGIDEVFGMPSAWGLGYGIGGPTSMAEERPTVFGVPGAGGSAAYADRATGTAFALTKNRLTTDFAAVGLIGDIVARG